MVNQKHEYNILDLTPVQGNWTAEVTYKDGSSSVTPIVAWARTETKDQGFADVVLVEPVIVEEAMDNDAGPALITLEQAVSQDSDIVKSRLLFNGERPWRKYTPWRKTKEPDDPGHGDR